MLKPFRFSNNDKYRTTKETEVTNVKNNLADENGYLFQRYLFYAEEGGIIYNYYVGKDYLYGIDKGDTSYPDGLEADIQKAIQYLEYAAEREEQDAQLLLGFIYLGWHGEEYKDEKKALKWIERAAKLGEGEAQYLYAEMYQNGTGVEKDPDTAYHWYVESAYNGFDIAMMELCIYYRNKMMEFPEPKEMTKEEIDEFDECLFNSFSWGKCAADNGQ